MNYPNPTTRQQNHRQISQRVIPGLPTDLVAQDAIITIRNPSILAYDEIGARTLNSSSSSSTQSVTERLQRLRAENIRHEANLSSTNSVLYNSSRFSQANRTTIPDSSTGQGPPAGWLLNYIKNSLSNTLPPITPRPRPLRSKATVEWRRLVRETGFAVCPEVGHLGVGSLMDVCLRILAVDISKFGGGYCAPFVKDLSETQKSRLLEIAAEWCPLDDSTFEIIFNLKGSSGEHDCDFYDEGEDNDDEGKNDFDKEEWENQLNGFGSVKSSLTVLELSFSSVTTQTLRNWLFEPELEREFGEGEGRATLPSIPTRMEDFGVLNAPNLTTLKLDNMKSMTVSNQLLNILSNLPLVNLSLAAQSLHPQLSNKYVLSKLSNATPGLETLNLSYNPSWIDLGFLASKAPNQSSSSIQESMMDFSGLDWQRRWPKLRVLGLVRNFNFEHLSYQQQITHLSRLRSSRRCCDKEKPPIEKFLGSLYTSSSASTRPTSYLICNGCGFDYSEEESKILRSRLKTLIERRISNGGNYIEFVI